MNFPMQWNWCRLCGSVSDNSVPIFEEDGLSNFAEKIKSYLHVEITTHDTSDVPRMCKSCSEKIISWDQYAEQVQKVQGLFMSLSSTENQNELLNSFTLEIVTMDNDHENEKEFCDSKEYKNGEIDIETEQKKELENQKTNKMTESIPVHCSDDDGDDDFSEDDDIPLARRIDCSSDFRDRSRNCHNGCDDDLMMMMMMNGDVKKKTVQMIKDNLGEVVKNVNDNTQTDNNGNDDLLNEVEREEETDDKVKKESRNESLKDGDRVMKTDPQPLFLWECLMCQAPVKNWNALVKHCKEVHDTTATVICSCGRQLHSRESIIKHRMKHSVGYGYKCKYENCNKTYHRQQLLDVHTLSHVPKELQPWMCCKCSRRFHTESLLKQHEKVHLPKEEKLIHPCEVCQKKFCSKSAVASHIRAVHFGVRPFVCDQCGHSFTSKGILEEHLTIHSDVYNFHCTDCNKSFKTKYRLKIHMDTHMETRYQCPLCTLTLNTRRTLRMHLLVHRDDKAFQCSTCGKAFKRSKDLKNHYNLHTGKRPYTCPFCLRTFAHGSNCRSHKRRMHAEELRRYEAALATGQVPVVPSAVTDATAYNERTNTPDPRDRTLNTEADVREDGDDVGGKNDRGEKDECDRLPPVRGDAVGDHLSQTTHVQYPMDDLYAFESSAVPAFPGAPVFFKQ